MKKQNDFSIEVIEIYPYPDLPKKKGLLEKGTAHVLVTLPQIQIEVKNISYQIYMQKKKKKVWINMPFREYKLPSGNISVPYITFSNKDINKSIIEIVQKEVLKLS